MTDSPTVPLPTPRRAWPWWVPGMALGLIAAAATAAVTQLRLSAQGTHRAESLVQLPADEPDDARQQYRLLLRSPSTIAKTLSDPTVAKLASAPALADPLTGAVARLSVAEAAPNVLSVTLTGTDPNEMAAFLEHHVKYFVDDATALDRTERTSRISKLEQYTETLRTEIEATEKQIELLGRANSFDEAALYPSKLRLFHEQLLQKRITNAETERARVDRERIKLEAEFTVLEALMQKKDAAPPDPARVERLAELRLATSIKIEEQKRINAEFRALLRDLTAAQGSGLNMKSLERGLVPQRENLQKINTKLLKDRLHMRTAGQVSARGSATVAPVRTGGERVEAVGVPTAIAFVGGFVVATGLGFVGLVFRVLRRYG